MSIPTAEADCEHDGLPVQFCPSRGRPSKLLGLMRETPELYAKMLTFIRAGAFSHVAAAAIGIAPETFSRWMGRGDRERRGLFRQFRQDVMQAQAIARLSAEIEVYRDAPLSWLRYGPGRTTPERPGWTDLPQRQPIPVPSPDPRPGHQPPPAGGPQDLADGLRAFAAAGFITITPLGEAVLCGADDERSDDDGVLDRSGG